MAKTDLQINVTTTGQQKVDKLDTSLNKLDKAAKKVQGDVPKAANGIRLFGKSSAVAATGVKTLGTAISATLGPIGAALLAIGGLTAAFQTLKTQDFAQAKFKSLGGDANALVEELKRVSDELNGSASVAELTAAAYDVASAGFIEAADAAAVLKAATQGAVGGFSDINTVANAATSVLNAYGMGASEAGALIDKFIQTQNDGKIVVAEYAANIGKVAAAAAGLKVPLSEVNAVIAQSTASGVQAEVAFTGLKTALAQLASGQATERMKELGLDINAATIEVDGLLGTLKKIKESGADVGEIFKLLGTESAPALLPILNNLERFEELLKNQEESAGAAAEAQALAADTIQGAWNRVSNALSNIFSEQAALGEFIKETLNAFAEVIKITGVALNFLLDPLGKAKKETEGLATAAEKAAREQEELARDSRKAAQDAIEAAAAKQAALEKEVSGLREVSEQINNQTLALQTQQAQADNGLKVTAARLAAEKVRPSAERRGCHGAWQHAPQGHRRQGLS